jgi:hypothetical protein
LELAQFFTPIFQQIHFMEKDQNRQAAQTQEDVVKNTSPEQGRQPGGPQQTATEQNADISNVDQQEGEMNHGELGGNFDATDGAGA